MDLKQWFCYSVGAIIVVAGLFFFFYGKCTMEQLLILIGIGGAAVGIGLPRTEKSWDGVNRRDLPGGGK